MHGSPPLNSAEKRIGAAPWFTLAVLTFAFTVGFVDRQLLNLLVQPIKTDLGLTDIEISLLQGAAFSIAYLLMSPIFGRLVDLHSRRNLLLGCILVWTAFTGVCGIAGSFIALFMARSMVGAAEAGLTPSAWSMLTDRFEPAKLPRAFSIYHLGTYIGSGLAMVLGGVALAWVEGQDFSSLPLLADMKPWQTTFLLVSLLGLPCALLVGMLIEPQRHSHKPGAAITSPSLREAWSELWLNRAFYVPFYLGMALAIIPIYAFPAWVPATAMRQFGVSVSRVGIDYGTVSLISGSLGVLAGPSLARLGARMGFGRDINVRLTAWCALAVLACCVAFFFRTSYGMTIGIAAVVGFFYAIPTPMAGSALQLATPPHVRGLASGIYIVVVTLMGLGVAPLTVAFLTDKLFADEQRVGDALAIVCAVSALASAITLSTALPAYRRLMSNLDKQ